MKKSYLVLGLGKFGTSVAKRLSEFDCDVLAVDKVIEKVQDASSYVTRAVKLDIMDSGALKSLSLNNFDVAIIAISYDLEASILATLMLKEAGVPKVIAKAKNDIHKNILEKMGVDIAVLPEDEMGKRLANSLVKANIIETIDLSTDYSLLEIKVYDEWVKKPIGSLKLREKYGLNVLAIKGEKKDINISPCPEDVIESTDILIVIAENAKWEKMNM
ncbi:MAG: TrkA family potassium uptake protein [Lachnospiraceae bacterium]|jgi:trk system potassium uptake protein TrkA|nr:TrkA family potassium uptake protein [Lachnospiraceae bacterium]